MPRGSYLFASPKKVTQKGDPNDSPFPAVLATGERRRTSCGRGAHAPPLHNAATLRPPVAPLLGANQWRRPGTAVDLIASRWHHVTN